MRIMRTQRTATGFVYIVSAPNGYAKIGKASNPFERFTMIQCSSPLIVTLEYVCECPNPVDIEMAAHEILDAQRRHREWFEVTTETAVAAVRTAMQAAGISAVPAPHRAERKAVNCVGAPVLLRPRINEVALASV